MANLKIPDGDKNSRILLDQINARTRQRAVVDGKFPRDLKNGDGTTRLSGDNIHIGMSDGRSVKEFRISREASNLGAMTTSTSAPTTTELPDSGDWGWHYDSSAGKYYIARNESDVIVYPNFVSISGSITASQHGSQTSGTLHAAATTSVAGFLSAADKTILDNATSANTASVIVKRDANKNIFASGCVEPVVTKTTTYTAALTDSVILCDSSSGAFTITLPTAVGNTGKVFTFKKINAVGNIVTIDGNGSETIDGAATITFFTQWNMRQIISDGSNWLLIGSI